MNHKWLAKIQKKTDIRKRINKKCTFSYFFCPKIWSYQKKAVPLHSLLKNGPFRKELMNERIRLQNGDTKPQRPLNS